MEMHRHVWLTSAFQNDCFTSPSQQCIVHIRTVLEYLSVRVDLKSVWQLDGNLLSVTALLWLEGKGRSVGGCPRLRVRDLGEDISPVLVANTQRGRDHRQGTTQTSIKSTLPPSLSLAPPPLPPALPFSQCPPLSLWAALCPSLYRVRHPGSVR